MPRSHHGINVKQTYLPLAFLLCPEFTWKFQPCKSLLLLHCGRRHNHSRATVTKHHGWSGLKQEGFVVTRRWRLEVPKSRWCQGCAASEGSGGRVRALRPYLEGTVLQSLCLWSLTRCSSLSVFPRASPVVCLSVSSSYKGYGAPAIPVFLFLLHYMS